VFQKLLKPFDKDVQAAGKMLTVGIEQSHWHRLGTMTGHHLDKFAGVQVTLHVKGWNLDEAKTGEATGDISFRAVHSDAAA
jgi:hypothetical protein